MLFCVVLATWSVSSTPAPAADTVMPVPPQSAPSADDEQFSQLFCIQRQDMVEVRNAYVEGGDILARKTADSFVEKRRCDYRATVITIDPVPTPCDTLANGYCISVQPVITCKNDEQTCSSQDGIHGFDLEEPKVASGKFPPDTEVMRPVRTIIFNAN